MLQSLRQLSSSTSSDIANSSSTGNQRESELREERMSANPNPPLSPGGGGGDGLGRRPPPRKGSFGRRPPPAARRGRGPPPGSVNGIPGSPPPPARGPPPPARGGPPSHQHQPGARTGFPAPPPRGGIPPRSPPPRGGSLGRKNPMNGPPPARRNLQTARPSPPPRRTPPSSNSSTGSSRSVSKSSSASFQPGAANPPRAHRATTAFTRPASASVGAVSPDSLRRGSNSVNSNSRSRSHNPRSLSRSSMKRNSRLHSRSNSSVNSQEIERFNSTQAPFIETSRPTSDTSGTGSGKGPHPRSLSSSSTRSNSERESSRTSTTSDSTRSLSDSRRSSDPNMDMSSAPTSLSQQQQHEGRPQQKTKRPHHKHSQTISGLPAGFVQAHTFSPTPQTAGTPGGGRVGHHQHSQTMTALPASFTMQPPSRPPPTPRATRTAIASPRNASSGRGTFPGPTSPAMNGDSFFGSNSTAQEAPPAKIVPKGTSPSQWKLHLGVMQAIRRSVRKGTHPKAHLVEVFSSSGYEPPSVPASPTRALSPLRTGLRFLDRSMGNSRASTSHSSSPTLVSVKDDAPTLSETDLPPGNNEEKSEFLPKAFEAVESYAQISHQFPAVQNKINSGLELVRTMDGFMQKYHQALEKFAQEVSKAAVTYQKKLDALPENKTEGTTISWRSCHEILQNVRDVSARQLVLAQKVTTSSSKMSAFRQQGMKLSEAYADDRRKIREKLNHDVRALEKSRTRAQKALSDATQTQMNHLITKTKEQQRILSAVSSQGTATPKSSKSAKNSLARSKSKLEKSKDSMLAKQEEAHSFAKSHAANINIYNKRLTFFHEKEIPSVFLHMQALDESRINTLKESLGDFVRSQKDFGQDYLRFGLGIEQAVESIDAKEEQSEFLAQSVEKYGPFRGPRRLKYDLQRTPSNIRSIQDKIRLETGGPSFEEMLHENSLLRTYFRQFLKDTYSLENFQFYRSVEDYHTITEESTRALRAKEIFETYVQDEAPKCINIQNHEREYVVRNWEKHERNVFDAAAASVRHLMKTCSYKEFMGSKTYESYLSEVSQL